MNWVYALLGAGGFLGGAALTHSYMTSEAYKQDAELTYPPLTSIILPTYNEEYFVENALKSIVSQNIYRAFPHRFEIIVADSESKDRTAEISRCYTDKVLSMPKGKLNAKHLAILDSVGEIIVSVDADCVYPCNWLNIILSHFQDPNVVAVGGCSYILDAPTHIKLGYVLQAWKLSLGRDTLIGRASAFRKQAYVEAGGYRLDFNQLDVSQVQYWEEVEIVDRLRTFGRIMIDARATVITSPRLFYSRYRAGILGVPPLKNGKAYSVYSHQIESGERM